MSIDLTGEISAAVDGALLRGSPLTIGYIDDEGKVALSFRGSMQVLSGDQLAFWSRKRDDGIVTSIAERPDVTLIFFEGDGPGPKFLSIRGRARVDESANDAVFAAMVEPEQQGDAERKGVAVVIDVDSVRGMGAGGPFEQTR